MIGLGAAVPTRQQVIDMVAAERSAANKLVQPRTTMLATPVLVAATPTTQAHYQYTAPIVNPPITSFAQFVKANPSPVASTPAAPLDIAAVQAQNAAAATEIAAYQAYAKANPLTVGTGPTTPSAAPSVKPVSAVQGGVSANMFSDVGTGPGAYVPVNPALPVSMSNPLISPIAASYAKAGIPMPAALLPMAGPSATPADIQAAQNLLSLNPATAGLTIQAAPVTEVTITDKATGNPVQIPVTGGPIASNNPSLAAALTAGPITQVTTDPTTGQIISSSVIPQDYGASVNAQSQNTGSGAADGGGAQVASPSDFWSQYGGLIMVVGGIGLVIWAMSGEEHRR